MNTENELPLGLYWKGKRTVVDRTVLPFQSLEVIETVQRKPCHSGAEKPATGWRSILKPRRQKGWTGATS